MITPLLHKLSSLRLLALLCCLGTVLAFSQCRSAKPKTQAKDARPAVPAGFTVSPTGLQYKYFPAGGKADPGARKPKLGEIMSLHVQYRNGSDSLLYSSYQMGQPVMVPVVESTFKGSLEEAIFMLSPGDSGVFRINADSLFTKTFKQPMPPFIKPGSFITFHLKSIKLMSQEEVQAEQQREQQEMQRKAAANAAVQVQKDEDAIKKYIAEKGLKAQRTPSGLYYVITKPGTGPNAKAGQSVNVHYTGTTLDGKKFDSSVDRGQPFKFQLGQGQVIRGWDEGIALLNKGAKATLLIPSQMAYGERSPSGAIPPNSVLIFDVELIGME